MWATKIALQRICLKTCHLYYRLLPLSKKKEKICNHLHYGATFSKYQAFLRSPSTFLLLFFSVANFNKHNAFGNQPKTMFLCGMLKDEILYIVQQTILCPDVHTIERGGTHVAKKTFPYDVGEFVEFDQADKLCTRLLNVVKVVFTKNKHGNIRVITAYPTMCKHKISWWAFDADHATIHFFSRKMSVKGDSFL